MEPARHGPDNRSLAKGKTIVISADQVYVPSARVAFRNIAGKVVLVDTREDKMLTLNATATAIWERLDGRTIEDIASEISTIFEVSPEQATNDTLEYLDNMLNRGFLEIGQADPGGQ